MLFVGCSHCALMLLRAGSKCKCICDLLSSGGCISGNTNGQQSADRRTNAEGVAGYNQVLQSLSEEHTVFKAGMDVRYAAHSTCYKSFTLIMLTTTATPT